MPLPAAGLHPFDLSPADLIREQRAKPVPPKSYRFVADIDAALVQQILDIPERQREPHIEHHCQAGDLRARFEVLEKGAFGHARTLPGALPRLKRSSFDKTETGVGGGGVRPIQHALAKPWSNLELVAWKWLCPD